MRKTADRIRHAISFELIGLGLVIPLGTLAFAMPAKDIGVVGVVGATLATFWNYIYNLGFDHLLNRAAHVSSRSAESYSSASNMFRTAPAEGAPVTRR